MNAYDLSQISKLIRDKRIALRLSQEEVAERAGLHRTYIGAVERGERNLTLKTLYSIANALSVAPADLLP